MRTDANAAFQNPSHFAIANRIAQRRTDVRKRSQAILVVEGATDRRMHSTYADENCHIEPVGGKSIVHDVMDTLQKRNIMGVLAILDKDHDPLLGRMVSAPDLLYTDTHDLESMMLRTQALEKLLLNYSIPPVQSVGLREKLLDAAKPLGYLRLINERNNYGLKFSDLTPEDFFNFVDSTQISIDMAKLITCLLPSRTRASRAELERQLLTVPQRSDDPWIICKGHDMMEILAIVLSSWCDFPIYRKEDKRYPDCPPDADCLEAKLTLAFEYIFFQASELYKGVRTWEEHNAPMAILKRYNHLYQGT